MQKTVPRKCLVEKQAKEQPLGGAGCFEIIKGTLILCSLVMTRCMLKIKLKYTAVIHLCCQTVPIVVSGLLKCIYADLNSSGDDLK